MSRDDARRTVIAYDIPDDRRRARLARLLLGHGDRVQYSVFVVDSSPARLVRLRSAVGKLIDAEVDSVLYCDLGLVSEISVSVFSWDGRDRPLTPSCSIIV